jgi:hypothetical protein
MAESRQPMPCWPSSIFCAVRGCIGEGEPQTFNVPPGIPGTVWTVFELDGQTGVTTPINRFSFELNSSSIDSF